MRIMTTPRAEEFLEVVEADLLRHEAEHSLILSVALRVRDGHPYGQEPPFFLSAQDKDRLVAAVAHTPPHGIILHGDPERRDALERVAEHMAGIGHRFPTVHGATSLVEQFCRAWQRETGQFFTLRMSQRLYCLTDVQQAATVAGSMRWATAEDVPLLAGWWAAFIKEATHDAPPPDLQDRVLQFIQHGRLAVWEDGSPVSMVGSGRGTSNGRTIAPVYTPQEARRRGYATACVSALCRHLLSEGSRFCTLYTDLSNPTSNRIYQRVGFRPLADCAVYTLVDPDR